MLYRQVSEHARNLGRSTLHMFSFEDDPDTAGFAARHGFTVSGSPLPRYPPRWWIRGYANLGASHRRKTGEP